MHAMNEFREKLKERARAAAGKPAAYGSDLDLRAFVDEAPEACYVDSLEELEDLGSEELARAGVEKSGRERSGSFVQIDGTVVHRKAMEKGLEILGTREALEKYDWLWDHYWQAVAVDADKYTAAVELSPCEGYFMRALPGSRTIYPLQACLYIREPRFVQRVHTTDGPDGGRWGRTSSSCAGRTLWTGRGSETARMCTRIRADAERVHRAPGIARLVGWGACRSGLEPPAAPPAANISGVVSLHPPGASP